MCISARSAEQRDSFLDSARGIKELISRMESNDFHFQERHDYLLEGGSLVLP